MHYRSFDGTSLHVTEMGDGPALLLIHGLFSNAEVNWVRFGTARKLMDAGYRLIMPDLRGHGQSDAPLDADAWPADVLSRDIEALVEQLGLGGDFVLGGFSLGARTTARLLARGMRPRAAIFAGMGLEGLTSASRRSDWFITMIEGRGQWKRGDPYFMAEAFMKTHVTQPDALVHLLRQQLDTPADVLAGFDLPALVVCGTEDEDNGPAPDLARLLPQGRYTAIPGTHMSSVTKPELAAAMIDFLESL